MDETLNPTDRAVVLVHGTRTSHTQWDPQLPAFREAGYRVFAPDFPGHGTRRGEQFTTAAATDTITAAIAEASAQVGPGRVHLIGASLGGMIAIHAAGTLADELNHPLASVTVFGSAVQPTRLTAAAYAGMVALGDRIPGARATISPETGDPVQPWLFRYLIGSDETACGYRGGRADIPTVRAAMRTAGELDLVAALYRIPVPVAIVSPRFDQLRLHERRFAAAAPKGRLVKLPYGSHAVNVAHPDRFNADLLQILAHNEGAGWAGPVIARA
ncbi:alpha/beta fold hydrolase [Granulicoccus phenolivorans]|uniref:alpha/beta fold hydrolase n=1 Tax=Granulicoccus phenolivorans TaxID=266854 RepID=UPI0004224E03|nr:alpha/beta hydrolase [Granulicoccus phenolivorans]